jgi:pyruvate/2-oxoglutarate dehydrogenase complex dihydrolipoamide acyltransferase (E2) component
MKITMSFDVSGAEDLAEARKMFDRLRWVGKDFGEDEPTPGETATPPPLPPPPTPLAADAPPPPPPPPPAPAPETATVEDRLRDIAAGRASAAPEVAVDGAGRPWDERFHAKSKNKIKDGTWRRKRGVSQEEVDAAMPVSAPAASVDAPPPPPPPPAPATVGAPPPPPAPASNGEVAWDTVSAALTARAAKYTQDQVRAVLHGALIEPTTLFATPGQYAAAIAALEAGCPL